MSMKVELISYTLKPIETIEKAASNCYDNKNNVGTGKILKHCIQQGHTSVAEFAQFHFHIEGISRACSHQLVRHRTASFAQRSQRYVNEDVFEYVIPKSIIENEDVLKMYDDIMARISWFYKFARHNDIPSEDARFILPNACETTIDVSFDFRNLMHFMNERLCANAQWEIRKLATLMKDCVCEVAPELKEFLVPKCEINSDFPMCNEGIRSCGRHKTANKINEMINKIGVPKNE